MTRKTTIRNSPNWLDALDLPPDPPLPRVYPAPRTAIAARRRALERRPVVVSAALLEAPAPARSAPWSALATVALLVTLVAACARSAGWL